MLPDLLVIVGMEVLLLVAILAMSFHRKRGDVLSGRYFENDRSDDVTADMGIGLSESEQKALQRHDTPVPALAEGSQPPPRRKSETTRWQFWRSWTPRAEVDHRPKAIARAHGSKPMGSLSGVGGSTGTREEIGQMRPGLPDGIRIYAVGDIHGRSDLLKKLLAAIDADCEYRPVRRPITVFVGDYIDRGPDSCNVLDVLLQWRRTHETIFLCGNHETFLPRFLSDPSSLEEWRRHGGLETLLSYGLKPSINTDRDEQAMLATQLAEVLPQQHLDFLLSLELTFSCGDFLFVHAGLRPGVPIHQQTEDDLLWIRDDFLGWDQPFERFVVHGHTPVNEPDLRTNRINIDTGAYATGRLTCIAIEKTAITQLAFDDILLDETFSVPSTRAVPDPARA